MSDSNTTSETYAPVSIGDELYSVHVPWVRNEPPSVIKRRVEKVTPKTVTFAQPDDAPSWRTRSARVRRALAGAEDGLVAFGSSSWFATRDDAITSAVERTREAVERHARQLAATRDEHERMTAWAKLVRTRA